MTSLSWTDWSCRRCRLQRRTIHYWAIVGWCPRCDSNSIPEIVLPIDNCLTRPISQPVDWLVECPYCREPVFRLINGNDYDSRPWAIADEALPWDWEQLTTAKQRSWTDDRPYRLGLVIIDFGKGICRAAAHKPRQKPTSSVLFKPHWCGAKIHHFHGVEKWPLSDDPTVQSSTRRRSTSSAATAADESTAAPTALTRAGRSARGVGRSRASRP